MARRSKTRRQRKSSPRRFARNSPKKKRVITESRTVRTTFGGLGGRCDKIVTKHGPKVYGKFCERVVAPTSQFDRSSIRTLVFDGGRRVVITGCPKGKFQRGVCSEGTRAHAVLKKIANGTGPGTTGPGRSGTGK